MTEDDLKAVLAKYQQKTFELYNTNIILETQVEQLNKKIASLEEQLPKTKRTLNKENDFQ
jgi:2C-methyl-D-erythritol 2,4-cyclodiphosphate synthase